MDPSYGGSLAYRICCVEVRGGWAGFPARVRPEGRRKAGVADQISWGPGLRRPVPQGFQPAQ